MRSKHGERPPRLRDILEKMRADWNRRARENAEYYIESGQSEWTERDFFRSGEINVANEVMTDMPAICRAGRSPLDLRVVEIGCGIGRMTRMLARIFAHVTGVDVSDEMIARCRSNTADLNNVELLVGDGSTLRPLPDASCDFAFSFIVFQHIPSYEAIRSYCLETWRVLKPGGLFKFQVQGADTARNPPDDTWLGCPVSESDAMELAEEAGFVLERSLGPGTQYFWLWFRKPE